MTDGVALAAADVAGRCCRGLRRFARTLTRHAHDADDLAQIALERALAARGAMAPAGGGRHAGADRDAP